MKDHKITSVSTFRSTTISNRLSKTYVIVYNTGVVMIVNRLLMNFSENPKSYISVKQYKNFHLLENVMAFKINSFNTIVEIVNNVKPHFNESDIEL